MTSNTGGDDIYPYFISIEVSERARRDCTHAGCPNAMSNRSYDPHFLFVNMEVYEKAREGGKTSRILGSYSYYSEVFMI